MKMLRFFLALACSTVLAVPVAAFDLTKIDRKIVREPAYQSKAKYCLLAVGPEAKTRVWLVLDGDVLYVDRNGNADLTTAKKVRATADTEKDQYTFLCGGIRDGEFTHQNLTVRVEKRRGYSVSMDVETPGHKGKGIGGRIVQFVFSDAKGLLQFADDPKDAPVIHFGGPWQVTLLGGQRLAVGHETHLELGVGTPGLGSGTTAFISYEGVVPESAHPTVEITYPPRRKGGPPLREHFELRERC
jgi:hypothetical protein